MILKAPKIGFPLWLEAGLGWLAIAIASPLIATLAVMFGILWLHHKILGPGEEWSRWFAWRPVAVQSEDPDAWPSDREWRWLEMVERRSHGFMSGTFYRRAGGAWEPRRWQI